MRYVSAGMRRHSHKDYGYGSQFTLSNVIASLGCLLFVLTWLRFVHFHTARWLHNGDDDVPLAVLDGGHSLSTWTKEQRSRLSVLWPHCQSHGGNDTCDGATSSAPGCLGPEVVDGTMYPRLVPNSDSRVRYVHHGPLPLPFPVAERLCHERGRVVCTQDQVGAAWWVVPLPRPAARALPAYPVLLHVLVRGFAMFVSTALLAHATALSPLRLVKRVIYPI